MEHLLGSLSGLISTIVYFVIIFSVINRVKKAAQQGKSQNRRQRPPSNGDNGKPKRDWNLVFEQAAAVIMQGQTPNRAFDSHMKQQQQEEKRQRRSQRRKLQRARAKQKRQESQMQWDENVENSDPHSLMQQPDIQTEQDQSYAPPQHIHTVACVNFSKNDLKKAIIYSEIIGLPKSLRDESSRLPFEA